MKNFTILTTSEFNASEGTYKPVSSVYRANVNERINYRGLRSPYHINNTQPDYFRKPTPTQAQRQEMYEVKCLENGVRPYGYSDQLWNQYLRDCASEEHTNRCEAQRAWQYQL